VGSRKRQIAAESEQLSTGVKRDEARYRKPALAAQPFTNHEQLATCHWLLATALYSMRLPRQAFQPIA
jgi:hypothetical protein